MQASLTHAVFVWPQIGGLRSTGTSAFAVFDKMEQKVAALEAEAQSVAAITAPNDLEARFELVSA